MFRELNTWAWNVDRMVCCGDQDCGKVIPKSLAWDAVPFITAGVWLGTRSPSQWEAADDQRAAAKSPPKTFLTTLNMKFLRLERRHGPAVDRLAGYVCHNGLRTLTAQCLYLFSLSFFSLHSSICQINHSPVISGAELSVYIRSQPDAQWTHHASVLGFARSSPSTNP